MKHSKSPAQLRVRIAQDLTTIVELWSELPDEYEHRAASKDMPGGQALALAAPATSLTAWWFRYEHAHQVSDDDPRDPWSATEGGSNYGPDQDDARHPLLVLAEWEDGLRYLHAQPTDLDTTVASAAAYIRGKLDWMLSLDDEGRVQFPAVHTMAEELSDVRTSLENAKRAGDRAEWTDVRCINPDCAEHPRLIKMFGAKAAWDAFKCPACRTRYDDSQYLQAKRQQLTDSGADRFVLVADAAATARIPRDTLNSWVRRLNVVSICEVRTRRVLVWWPDVRARADEREKRLVADRAKAERLRAEKQAKAERERKAEEQERRAAEPTREAGEARRAERPAWSAS